MRAKQTKSQSQSKASHQNTKDQKPKPKDQRPRPKAKTKDQKPKPKDQKPKPKAKRPKTYQRPKAKASLPSVKSLNSQSQKPKYQIAWFWITTTKAQIPEIKSQSQSSKISGLFLRLQSYVKCMVLAVPKAKSQYTKSQNNQRGWAPSSPDGHALGCVLGHTTGTPRWRRRLPGPEARACIRYPRVKSQKADQHKAKAKSQSEASINQLKPGFGLTQPQNL